jgi:molybdopterin molybdotransferase
MMSTEQPREQRIKRLTSVADVLSRIDALVRPVAPRTANVAGLAGRILAEDVVAPATLPAMALALGDGFAVRAEETADAGPYAPAPLGAPPVRVDVADPLPPGTDAVAALDTIVNRAGRIEALMPVAAGDGVLLAGADMRTSEVLRRAGEPLRGIDCAVLSAVGIAQVSVREPCIHVVKARTPRDPFLDAIVTLMSRAIAQGGAVLDGQGEIVVGASAQPRDTDLATALADDRADAVIAIGGTGSGRSDASVRTLARVGRVEVHGVALLPGETTAFGFCGSRPVLILPGRIDAALAAWLVLGRHLLARLAGRREPAPTITGVLGRKVASSLGMTEVVPVQWRGETVEPIASGYLPLAALAQADGWILVPAESEGFPPGAEVMVRPWP